MPTELEFRGPLTKDSFDKLDRRLRSISKKHKILSRLSMIYFPPGFGREDMARSRMDVRLRINNNKPELVMKTGTSDSADRSEFTIEISQASFLDTVDFLLSLGFVSGFLQRQSKRLYEYKGMEIDLGYIEHFGHYFEIEKVVYSRRDIPRAKKDIARICNELGLRFYGKREYEEAIERLDRMQKTFDLRRESIAKLMKSNPDHFREINAAYTRLKKRNSYVYRY